MLMQGEVLHLLFEPPAQKVGLLTTEVAFAFPVEFLTLIRRPRDEDHIPSHLAQ